MGFTLSAGVPALTVFLQGLLSFFSPCVLPVVPLYIGYLAGGAQERLPDGSVRYPRKKVLLNTLFFVLGVSFAFVVLGLGVSALGRFFSGNRAWLARVGGIVIFLFGLYQLGVFGSSQVLSREHRLPFRLDRWAMNPFTALVLGFVFSFAWTPCVGPALTSVLLMASSAASSAAGFLLIGVYTLGFVLPFLAVGLFTGSVLNFFKTHQEVLRYTGKLGGALMILMGVMMFTGWMNGLTGYLSSAGTTPAVQTQAPAESPAPESAAPDAVPAPDFTLTDQNGESHTLSDYRGKVVFLNFWATWCGPCRREMPDIQKLYESYGGNAGEDLVVLSVANPKTDDHPGNSDGSVEEVTLFLENGGYTYPALMDTTGAVFGQYGVSAFPTTFMIDREGNLFGYVSGTLSADMMENIVRQTLTSVPPSQSAAH